MKKIKVNKKVVKVTGIIAAIIAVIGVVKYFTPEEYTEEVLPDDDDTDIDYSESFDLDI